MIVAPKPPTPEEVAHHYDSLDFFYRDTWGPHLHHGYWEKDSASPAEAIAHLTRAVAERARINASSHLCDVGSGYGAASWFIAEEYGAQVTGYTLSATQHAVAIDRKPKPNTQTTPPRFVHNDWLENDLADQSMDAVISIECVSHVDNKAKFFKEIRRVLKPGARMVLCAWIAPEKPNDWSTHLLLQPICRDGCFPGLASMSEYRTLIENQGLHIVEASDIGPQVAKTWHVILARLARKFFTDRRYTRFFLGNLFSERFYPFTILRLILAYRLRAIGYLLLVAEKPQSKTPTPLPKR